jgi:hypothetical protein
MKSQALLYHQTCSDKASAFKQSVIDYGKQSVQKLRTKVDKPLTLAKEIYMYRMSHFNSRLNLIKSNREKKKQ